MQEIFDKIKGREWDWFSLNHKNFGIAFTSTSHLLMWHKLGMGERFFSLADLLANQSWCKAVWGEGERIKLVEKIVPEQKIVSSIYGETLRQRHKIKRKIKINWKTASCEAFRLLQQGDYNAVIDYIKSTMV